MRAAGATFSGPLGEQLQRRLEKAIEDAHLVLGIEPGATGGDDLSRLRTLTAALGEHASSPAAQVAAADHEAALERLSRRFEGRAQALARVQRAVRSVRAVTAPGEMLARAPAALCQGSRLTRVVLSAVRDGRMVAEAAHFAGDPAGARRALAQLQEIPVALEHPLIENELLRRRRATIVLDAAVHPRADRRTAQVMRWRSYVAAPLLVGPQVIGVIHGDRGVIHGDRGPDPPLDVLDRDVLWEFATGLGQAYESASLRRALRREREQTREFAEWINARSAALSDAPITLGAGEPTPVPLAPLRIGGDVAASLEGPTPPPGRDDRVVFSGLLTRRELDVLRLLAEGRPNRGIADALVLSQATVKFHVNSILRKLHAANRAEAVARYLALLGMPPP